MSIDKYLNLVPSENSIKPKFIAWLSVFLSISNDTTQLLSTMYDKFDIDNAVGVQLDTIGEYLGVARLLSFQPSGSTSAEMDDATYRIVLKAKIAKNHWDGTNQGLRDIWTQIFPSTIMFYSDNQDMSIDVTFVGITSQLTKELIENNYIIPKAMGVKYNYQFTDNVVFGFDLNNQFYSGFDVGYWS